MAEILIIDDDPQYCGMLAQHLQRQGHGVSSAGTCHEGLITAGNSAYDVIFLDIRLPDGSGLEAISQLQNGILPPEIIIITGFGTAESAEMAIRHGAWDFVHKHSSIQIVLLSLSRALQYRASRLSVIRRVAFHAPDILGNTRLIRNCLDTSALAASSDVSVLITGETGTGKELFATAIHENSPRADGPFIVVDCATLPKTLIESLLFGHEKGAFTGANSRQAGLISQADKGTLFLDEIGDLSSDIQKTFLRLLQERRFRPIGATKEIRSDFRILAATHCDLDRLAETGQFRRDLLFRLRGLSIHLPPLRERMTDIPLLTTHFVTRECQLRGCEIKGLSIDFSEALSAYDWPGNVRELYNAVAATVAAAIDEPVLYVKHLPPHIRIRLIQTGCQPQPVQQTCDNPAAIAPLSTFKEMRDHFEKNYFQRLIDHCGPDIESASRISGLSRPHIYTLIKKHDLKFRRNV